MNHPALNIATSAARNAARVLLRMLNQADRLSVREKQNNDFVTEADRAAERAIIETIHKAYPDHAFVAEESGALGEGEVRWIIDPLDGTKNYIHDYPHFSISIAQQINGRTELGLVYDPIREELFTAVRGRGAFLNDRRIRISDRRSLSGAVLATGFPFRNKSLLPGYLELFAALFERAHDVRRAGSAALDLAYTACGRVDGFWELGLGSWDMAAGALLVEEAGGMCTDFAGGSDYLASGNIVAANIKVAAALQAQIRAHAGSLGLTEKAS